MRIWQLLSTGGSDRATAYNMSNKLIRRDGELYVGWLDAPTETGATAQVMFAICDGNTGEIRRRFPLGEGYDNHCGPALALDGNGRLHAVLGAHHGAFRYRWSDTPADKRSWSSPVAIGPRSSYPSLAAGTDGTLHLAYREQGERWQLHYRRMLPGRDWEAPVSLAISPTPGYNHFMQSLTVGPSGTLHLTFQFHYAESGKAIDCTGRVAAHLLSENGGQTWYNEGIRCDRLPTTIDSIRAICRSRDGGLRVGNHVIDESDRVWLYGSLPNHTGGVLWHGADGGTETIDMTARLGGLNSLGGRSTSLTRDSSGKLHLAIALAPDGSETRWFDPTHELFQLAMGAEGGRVGFGQLTDDDPTQARWLPAFELWDWTRQDACCADGPWLLYTEGLNQGGIGGDNRNTTRTNVYLAKP